MIALTLLLATALLAAACAEAAPPTLGAGTLEASLPAAVWPADPALVSEVDCPDLDLEVIAQSTLCTAVLDTDAVTIDVAVDELGRATAEVREPLFVVASAADALVSRLERDLSIDAIDADCEGTVIVAEPARVLSCQATSSGRTISFELVLGGEDGTWMLTLGEQ